MVFSDTTTKLGAIQYCEFYCNLGDAGISGSSLLLKQFTGLINRACSEVWHLIFALNNGWKYDDSNQTDLPQATQTLVASISKYALPPTALAIDRIEIMDSSGAYQKIQPLRLEQISIGIDEFYKTDGMPQYYRLLGSTIELFPAPAAANVTLAAGLKVYFDRASVSFASTDTSASFGFASEYHDIPPRKASIEWLKVNKPESSTLVALIKDDIKRESQLQEFEAVKFRDVKPNLQPKYIRGAFK